MLMRYSSNLVLRQEPHKSRNILLKWHHNASFNVLSVLCQGQVKVTLKVTHLGICRKEVVYVEVDEFEDEAAIQEREAFLQMNTCSQTCIRFKHNLLSWTSFLVTPLVHIHYPTPIPIQTPRSIKCVQN